MHEPPCFPSEFFTISFTFIYSVIFERQEESGDEILFAFVLFVAELVNISRANESLRCVAYRIRLEERVLVHAILSTIY